MAPAAGHFLNLAAHVWFRTGRYADATAASLRAIAADGTWVATSNPEPGLYVDGYIPHHFAALSASAAMQGASGRALAAASEVENRVDLDRSRQPGYEALQHAWAAPFFTRVRFGRWDEILAEPAPPSDLPYSEAIWHFARGMAQVAQQQPDEAKRELEALSALAADPKLRGATMWEINKLDDLLSIAQRLLAAELAAQRSDVNGALTLLKDAVALEDGLHFDEPPPWPLPMRHYLGAALLDAGKAAEAQAVYEADLARYPDNGWSLTGLEAALKAQGKSDDAAAVEKRRAAAFKDADITIPASRF
jgi:tetratricopeptide (TPR) repeat protein